MKYVLLFVGTMEPEERAQNPELATAYSGSRNGSTGTARRATSSAATS